MPVTKWSNFPEDFRVKSIKDIQNAYEKQRYQGCVRDPEADAKLIASLPYPNGADAAHHFGFAGSGAGKLVVPFRHIEYLYPGSLPGPAQARGDCVSHGSKNAGLCTMCCEIVAATPDSVTGRIEGAPKVSADGISNGVLSTEAIYWWRDHGGDGWSCAHAADVVLTESGLWLRQVHEVPGYGQLDLTKYSGGLAGKWGRSSPPDEIKAYGLEHQIRTATVLESFEEVCDYLDNGYGISSCGGEGFSSERDENGVSRRKGGWSHAMAYLGADSRPWAMDNYGGLVLVQNSWARFNSGPRKIHGTTLQIPHGSFWARWSDLKKRYMAAFSGFAGFPPQKLPDFGATGII